MRISSESGEPVWIFLDVCWYPSLVQYFAAQRTFHCSYLIVLPLFFALCLQRISRLTQHKQVQNARYDAVFICCPLDSTRPIIKTKNIPGLNGGVCNYKIHVVSVLLTVWHLILHVSLVIR